MDCKQKPRDASLKETRAHADVCSEAIQVESGYISKERQLFAITCFFPSYPTKCFQNECHQNECLILAFYLILCLASSFALQFSILLLYVNAMISSYFKLHHSFTGTTGQHDAESSGCVWPVCSTSRIHYQHCVRENSVLRAPLWPATFPNQPRCHVD